MKRMSVVEEIKSRIDLVELVGQYVALRKSGNHYWGLCPFHSETKPSFVVYPSGSWHCFGACATGGDAIEFVKRIENLDFSAAVAWLAQRAGIPLAPARPEAAAAERARERLRLAVSVAVEFYHELLLRSAEAEEARAYLMRRAFWPQAAQEFRLGYAPRRAPVLVRHLRSAGYDDEELLGAGLARRRDDGTLRDAFFGRLMIPICDADGRAVGFGARTLDPEGMPKYLNTAQTPIFDKSRILFGLERAAEAIRRAGQVVIVEGYTDVMRAHLAGFENVVASLGTALTPEHVGLLKRFASVVVLALDADVAGEKAARRGAEVVQEAGLEGFVSVPTGRGYIRYQPRPGVTVRVATLPPGQDPDDVIREQPELWPRLIDGAQPLMEYLITTSLRDLDLSDPEQKVEAANRLLPTLGLIPDPVMRAAWLARLAERLRMDERTLDYRLKQLCRQGHVGGPATTGPQPAQAADAAAPRDSAAWLLGQLLADPGRLRELDAALKRSGQPEFDGSDLERAADRHLLQAIRYAAIGAVPPDAPAEHQLDMLPPPLADYAAAIREWVASLPVGNDAHRSDALWREVLHLRWCRIKREQEGLRYLTSAREADEVQAQDLEERSVQLAARRAAIERLLHGERIQSIPGPRSAADPETGRKSA